MLTYQKLLNILQALPEEQLNQTVTIFNVETSDCWGINGLDITGEENEQDSRPEEDVLDNGHVYLWWA